MTSTSETQIVIEHEKGLFSGDAEVEIVERKGLGHPDSICDALAEELSRALCLEYLKRGGRVLHHNVDKALLAAGAAAPRLGGGRILEPMKMILAGRAALEIEGHAIDVDALAEEVVSRWLGENLPRVDPRRDVVVSTAIRPGSSDLVDLFGDAQRSRTRANDSSCGVGFAPLSSVERMVLAIERRLRSPQTRIDDPALGADVKVMAFRHRDSIRVVLACAMVDGALGSRADYRKAKERAAEIALEAAREETSLPIDIEVNAGDDVDAGRMYLTVTGTSAEAGDDGQAGRGNRVNGLITPGRPMTIESVAGKNPITHVGKLYNLAASLIAARIVTHLPEVSNVECRMVSSIGCPIEEPPLVEIRLGAQPGGNDVELFPAVERLVREELREIPGYSDALLERRIALDRWPLRSPS